MSGRDSFNKVIGKYLTDSLDVKKLIGRDLKIIDEKIKDGRLLIKAVSQLDSSYFIIADIKKKIIVKKIRDPFNRYYTSSFDVSNNDIISFDATDNQLIYKATLLKNSTFNVVYRNKFLLPHKIVLNNNHQLFLTDNVYGISFVDLKSLKENDFANKIGETTNPISSNVSVPLSKSLNLISGQMIGSNTMQLYAIDSLDKIKWSYKLNSDNSQNISCYNIQKSFLIKNSDQIIALGKINGKLLWGRSFDYGYDLSVCIYGDRLLVILNEKVKPFSNDEENRQHSIIYLVDTGNGMILWKKEMNPKGQLTIVPKGEDLLFFENEQLTICSLTTGAKKMTNTYSKEELNKYPISVISDIINGDIYVKKLNDVYFW